MLTIFRWISRLPLPLIHALGGLLGWLTYALSPVYRQRFVANARQAGMSPAQYGPAIAEAGRLVAELPFFWMRPAHAPLSRQVRVEGAEVVEQALAQRRGILFLTPHLGCFEAIPQAYAERFGAVQPITVLYRPARKVWLRQLMAGARSRPGLDAAPATLAGVRQMIRALRRGEAVGLLPDQVPPDGMGVWSPFFGRPAYTMTLAARLAQQTGAVLLMAWGERLPGGAGYVVHFAAQAEALPARADAQADAQAESIAVINRAMEALIRHRPEQYLWGYDRYKSPRSKVASAPLEAPPPASDDRR